MTPSTLTPRTPAIRARRHRLAVGHHRERLQRGLGEALACCPSRTNRSTTAAQLRPGVEAPAPGDLAQLEAAALARRSPPPAPAAPRRTSSRGRSTTWASMTSATGSSTTSRIASSAARSSGLRTSGRASGPAGSSGSIVARRSVGLARPARAQVPDRSLGHVESPSRRTRLSRLVGPAIVTVAVELVDSSTDSGPSPPPVQRTCSSPSGRTCSKATAALAVQLEQGQEAGHDVQRVRAVGDERPEGRDRDPAQPLDQERGLLAHADRRRVQVGDRTRSGTGSGRSARAASAANSAGPRPSSTSGSRPAKRSSRPTARGNRRASSASRAASTGGHLLVGAVLQQPGEQQVAGLEQGEVLLVLDLAGRQQPGGLEVEQGGGDDQELGGLAEVPVAARTPGCGP